MTSARVESKYPGINPDYKVVVWDCPVCGKHIEEDYDERADTARHLAWLASTPCDECEEVRKAAPPVFDLISRIVENRIGPLEKKRPKHEIDLATRSLKVRDDSGTLVAMYELVPHPQEAATKEREEADKRLHAAVEEHIVETGKKSRFK